MDPVTHGFASYALCRAFYPRAPRVAVVSVLVAGTVADLDRLSVLSGPAAYFTAHRTFSHSLLGTLVLTAIVAAVFFLLFFRNKPSNFSASKLFIAVLLAAVFHLALDLCQSEGVALPWPFSSRRFAGGWIDGIDPWVLAVLLAGVLLPALFGLITEEIGAHSKKPRGRTAAWLALAAVALYLTGRMTLHANAVAALQARTYRGESPRRVAAYPEATSVFSWHGLVETDRALHEVPINVGPGASFDPEAGATIYKPEPSPLLDAAQSAGVARQFLRVARFPKAALSKTEDGYLFELRDLRNAAAGETSDAVAVVVDLTPAGKIRSQKFVWERELSTR